MKEITAFDELAKALVKAHPNEKWAKNQDETVIGVFVPDCNAYRIVFAKTLPALGGGFARFPMPDLCINGKRIDADIKWIPINQNGD